MSIFRQLNLPTNVLLMAVTTCVAGATASAAEPPNPNDLTQGNWELLVGESKFCSSSPPKEEARVIFDAGWGLISTIWTGIAADGSKISNRYVARYDGEKYPASINAPADEAITWNLVNPHRLEFVHWSKDGKITSEYVRVISPDGQTMTQHAKFPGQACEEAKVFQRRP